ncbi:hypothetical protein [uncultured Alistipes sp.]|uniref:hypothetical protein n=1 Tax=uncultured Alistipes sp. TaxID=538949 RepID=UPI0026312185|nr:hypothetical protein [uncultured Alistipes sp.]
MKNQNLSLFFIPWFDIETKAFIKTKSAIFFVDLYNSTKTGVFFYVFEPVSGGGGKFDLEADFQSVCEDDDRESIVMNLCRLE